MKVNFFYACTLEERMRLVRNYGEFVSQLRYPAFKISLYILRGEFIEVYMNSDSKAVDEVEILGPMDERLNLYATQVNLSDLFDGNL